AASVAYDAGTNTATLTPNGALAAGTTYTASIATTVTGSDGTPLGSATSWSFTAAGAPDVTAKSPAASATGVAAGTSVSATFAGPLDGASVTSSSFTLTADGATAPVDATVSYDSGSSTATLTPSSPLTAGATYKATLDATVKGRDGTPLGGAFSWSFTTLGGTPPSGDPTVTSTAPAASAIDADPAAVVKAVFSMPMDATTITASSYTLTASGQTSAVTA